VLCCAVLCCAQALRSRRLLLSAGSGSGRSPKRGSMHTMLTLQLDSYEADGTLLQRNTLSFVELAAPEAKVCYQVFFSGGSFGQLVYPSRRPLCSWHLCTCTAQLCT
jgi:hypothetical protein